MSELVFRIRELTARISDLEDMLLQEKRKYADEIDHSDQLSYLLSLIHDGKNCANMCSFCDAIRVHERRRAVDYGLTEIADEETA